MKVKIFKISGLSGETPEEVEQEVNRFLEKHPDTEIKVGGNFLVIVYDRENAVKK